MLEAGRRATAVHRAATARSSSRHARRLPSARWTRQPPPPPSPPTPLATVALTGVFNFRDLGGYAAADGRTVRWRTLFRADGLDRLTPADVEVLRPYGLRTVVDLRMAHELEEKGRFPVDSYPVTFHHLSVMDKTWDREAGAARGPPGGRLPARPLHRDARSRPDRATPTR